MLGEVGTVEESGKAADCLIFFRCFLDDFDYLDWVVFVLQLDFDV